MSVLFIVCGILGFFCQMLYANYFGSGKEMDIYFSLLSIPAIITGATGTIFSSLFFPAFARTEQSMLDGYIYKIKTYVSRIALIISILGFSITYLNLSSIIETEDTGFYNLALILSALFWLNGYISIVNGYLASVQNYFKNFLVVSSTQLLVYVFIILFVVLFHKILGVKSIAVGMLCAAVASLLINRYYGKIFHDSDCTVRIKSNDIIIKVCQIIITFLPFHAFASIAYLWAGKLEYVGGVSLLGYSHSFCGFLSTAASMGMATVAFPDLARNLSSPDSKIVYKGLMSFREQLEVVFVFASFVAVFASLFAHPIIEILFMRGEFTGESVKNLSAVLPFYFIDGVLISVMNITRNVFYSLEKQKILAVISAIVTLTFLGSSFLIADNVTYVGVGVIEALAMAIFVVLSLGHINSYKCIFSIRYVINIMGQIGILIAAALASFYVYNLTFAMQINNLLSLVVAGLIYVTLVDIILSKVFKSAVFCAVNKKIFGSVKLLK